MYRLFSSSVLIAVAYFSFLTDLDIRSAYLATIGKRIGHEKGEED